MMSRAELVEALRRRVGIRTSGILGDLGLFEIILKHLTVASNQSRVATWVRYVFSEEESSNVPERSLRAVEEVIELAQACGVSREATHQLVDYVFDRPVGDPAKEIAGCLVTIYAAASALSVDADSELEKELLRIQTQEVIDRIQRRQKEKREAIIKIRYPVTES